MNLNQRKIEMFAKYFKEKNVFIYQVPFTNLSLFVGNTAKKRSASSHEITK